MKTEVRTSGDIMQKSSAISTTTPNCWRHKMDKYALYELIKAEIARTAKSAEEYEKRIKALMRKLKI